MIETHGTGVKMSVTEFNNTVPTPNEFYTLYLASEQDVLQK